MLLDTQSAMNIVNSPKEIKVLYQGSPVWIQGINGDVAKVKFMGSDREGEVPVNALVKAD